MDRNVLIKRGLYYRPNAQGYTGLKDEAGRFPATDGDPSEGVTCIPFDEAPEIAPGCCSMVAIRHLTAKLAAAKKGEIEAIDAMAEARRECNDWAGDAFLWRYSIGNGDHPPLLTKLWERCKAAEKQLLKAERDAWPYSTFQDSVSDWVRACFGNDPKIDKGNRVHRFLEEALELAQATGCTQSEAAELVEYVFNRPAGDPEQEVGGTMLTLAALCTTRGIVVELAAIKELERVWRKIKTIRDKEARKPAFSPLPGASEPQDATMKGDDHDD